MNEPLRLMAVLAHPDDESLGVGGALSKCAATGVETFLVTATRGERGRYFTNENRPGDEEVGRVREAELRAAAEVLGVREVTMLGYVDGELDQVHPVTVVSQIVDQIRRVRPQVVVTFDPFGAYGHPDHVAICQFTTAAVAAAGNPDFESDHTSSPPHQVSKLYYFILDEDAWSSYQAAFRTLTSKVDGQERRATPWPDWSVSARIDTRDQVETIWRAINCHETQLAIYGRLGELTAADRERLWGVQTLYRALSIVNGGRQQETDIFAGIRQSPEAT